MGGERRGGDVNDGGGGYFVILANRGAASGVKAFDMAQCRTTKGPVHTAKTPRTHARSLALDVQARQGRISSL